MINCGFVKFKKNDGKYGLLVPIEEKRNIPFEMKRIYFIKDVPHGESRGYHSHRKLHQVLICANGSVKVKLRNPYDEEDIILNDETKGLYIGPMIWRELYDFSEDAVLIVLASDYFDEGDYIRNYDFYLEEAKKLF